METVLEKIYVDVPEADLEFFRKFAGKMGWTVDTKKTSVQKFIDSRRQIPELSENDILEALQSVRYEK